MINTAKIIKVGALWMSITYLICFAGVAIFPGIRSSFMFYALHTSIEMGVNALSWTTFLSGLILWDLMAIFGVWLFAFLFNKIKD